MFRATPCSWPPSGRWFASFCAATLRPLPESRSVTLSESRIRNLESPFPPYEKADTALAWRARVGTDFGDAERVPHTNGLADSPVRIDSSNGVFAVASPRTCGGFSDGAEIRAGALAATPDSFAAIWASTLDGKPFAATSRILVTHMTDVRQTGMEFEEQGEAGRNLLGWGRLPHLIRAGKADIALCVAPGEWTVFALNPDGTRAAQIHCSVPGEDGGVLRFMADIARDPANPVWLYECVRAPEGLRSVSRAVKNCSMSISW